MKRFTITALALLVVAGNARAMGVNFEDLNEIVIPGMFQVELNFPKMSAVRATAQAVSTKVAAAGKKAVQAMLAHPKKTGAVAATVALTAYIAPKIKEMREEGYSWSQIKDLGIFELRSNLLKLMAASAVAGHVYGASAVNGAQKALNVASGCAHTVAGMSSEKAVKMYQFLSKLGLLDKAAQKLATAKAAVKTVPGVVAGAAKAVPGIVKAHPVVAGSVAAAGVATTGAVVAYNKGLFGIAAELIKARFAKAPVAPATEVTEVTETK